MKKLETIDGATLMSRPFQPLNFVVDTLLSQGLHILAGSPKVGKSWLALWLAVTVAKGEPVWGLSVKQGTTLYLCLEDSQLRIQNRLFDVTEDAPRNVHFCTESCILGDGLEDQLRQFLAEHPDTSLIIIDTLQMIRGTTYDNTYANDYRDLSALKKLADAHDIAILLIHHLRKMNDDDPLNMISGTTGISGATDSSFVLKPDKRGSDRATLYCTGRDIEYRELSLEFQKVTHTWELTKKIALDTPHQDPQVILLSEFLRGLGAFDGTATKLSELLEQHTGAQILPSVLSKKLVRYTSELDKAGIHVASSRTRDSRLLHIVCDGSDGNDGKSGG